MMVAAIKKGAANNRNNPHTLRTTSAKQIAARAGLRWAIMAVANPIAMNENEAKRNASCADGKSPIDAEGQKDSEADQGHHTAQQAKNHRARPGRGQQVPDGQKAHDDGKQHGPVQGSLRESLRE